MFSTGADRRLPRGYVVAITVVRAEPDDRVLRVERHERGAVHLLPVWSVRRLVRWMVDDDVHHLVAAGGIAMALAYLTRYDAVGTVAAAGVLIGCTTYLRPADRPSCARPCWTCCWSPGRASRRSSAGRW